MRVAQPRCPLGELAVALGVGAALIGGSAVAYAEPAENPGAGTRAGARAESPQRSGPQRAVRADDRAEVRQRLRSPSTEVQTARRHSGAASRQADATGGGLGVLFANQSPALSPTQRTQGADGRITGDLNASDADSGALSYSVSVAPSHGEVTVGADGSFTYVPDATVAATGVTDSFVVTVSDAGDGFHLHGLAGLLNLITFGLVGVSGHVASTTVRLTVGPFGSANTAPRGTVAVGSPDPITAVVTGRVTGTDADGDALRYSGSTSTAKGAVIVSDTGGFVYTPTAAARLAAASPSATAADRLDSFTVTIDDARGGTATVGVTVAVLPAGSPPPATSAPLSVGMNLESIVDWSPAWTFTDAFKASRPWISQGFNPQTFALTWDPAAAPALDVDSDGNIRSLKTWTQNGVVMQQYAGTLMFDALGGGYAGGTYHAEWDGTGVVSFGFDATVTSTGTTSAGRNFAELRVTPTDSGIYLRIESTSPADPVRNINVWMPDYNGQSFVGQRWQPGADFSPFHPLFLARLEPFGTLRFMGWQETNTSDIVTWAQRRDYRDIRQGSGSEGTPSEPIANGVALEYMVELANELDADPWFNMPYAADDTFVRNFATYVSGHLEPGRTVYVEWANEIWNFGYGFEASQWVADKARAAGLDPDYGQWIVAGQEAKRDLDIWSQVFTGGNGLDLVRVAGGWAAVDWVTNQVLENMGGSFDAVAIAPYITPTDDQRAGYSAATSVDRVIADTRTNVADAVQWTANHAQLTADWSARLGRPIQLLAYEGGAHLDGRGAGYQNAFYAAVNDPRMGEIYREYIRALAAAGLDLYLDFQFTGQPGAAPWGDFAKFHRMDEPLATAYRYNAVVAAADGSLWAV